MAGFLRECCDLSSQQMMAETEVEEIVRMTTTVEPLGAQLQDATIVLDGVNPPANTISGLQYLGPAVHVGVSRASLCYFVTNYLLRKNTVYLFPGAIYV